MLDDYGGIDVILDEIQLDTDWIYSGLWGSVSVSGMVPPGGVYRFYTEDEDASPFNPEINIFAATTVPLAARLFIDPTTFASTGDIRAFVSDTDRNVWAPAHIEEVFNLPEDYSFDKYAYVGGEWIVRDTWVVTHTQKTAPRKRAALLDKASQQCNHWMLMGDPAKAEAWRTAYQEISQLADAPEWPLVAQWPSLPEVSGSV